MGIALGGIYYLDDGRLKFFDFERRDSRHLFTLDQRLQILSVTADGRTLILQRASGDSDLALLQAP